MIYSEMHSKELTWVPFRSFPLKTLCKNKVGMLSAGVYNFLLNFILTFRGPHSLPGLATGLLLGHAWSSCSFPKTYHIDTSEIYWLLTCWKAVLPCLSMFLLFDAHKPLSKGWGLEPHKPESLGSCFCFPPTQPQILWLKQKGMLRGQKHNHPPY